MREFDGEGSSSGPPIKVPEIPERTREQQQQDVIAETQRHVSFADYWLPIVRRTFRCCHERIPAGRYGVALSADGTILAVALRARPARRSGSTTIPRSGIRNQRQVRRGALW